MDNPRPEKVAVVTEVKEKLSASSAAILTEYRGLSVKDLATLRRTLREAGGDYKIYKNTLVRFAARDLGLELEEMLTGPTAVAFVEGDAVNVAKALRDFSRTNPILVVKGGLLGEKVLTAKDAAALAEVPPREVLLARLAGGLAAPLQQFAGLLQALPRNMAYGLKALIEQGGANPGAEAAPADVAAGEPAPEAAAEAPAETLPTAEGDELPESPASDATTQPPADDTPAPTADEAPADLPDSPASDATAEAPAEATENAEAPAEATESSEGAE